MEQYRGALSKLMKAGRFEEQSPVLEKLRERLGVSIEAHARIVAELSAETESVGIEVNIGAAAGFRAGTQCLLPLRVTNAGDDILESVRVSLDVGGMDTRPESAADMVLPESIELLNALVVPSVPGMYPVAGDVFISVLGGENQRYQFTGVHFEVPLEPSAASEQWQVIALRAAAASTPAVVAYEQAPVVANEPAPVEFDDLEEVAAAAAEEVAVAGTPPVPSAPPLIPSPQTAPPPILEAAALQKCVVAQDGTGDFSTIASALERVADSGEITVKDGLYKEALVINRPVSIIGQGEVMFEASGVVIDVRADANIVGMTVCSLPAGEPVFAMQSTDAALSLDKVHVMAERALRVRGGTIRLHRCELDGATETALSLASTRATVLGCTFSGSRIGVSIAGGNAGFGRCGFAENHRAIEATADAVVRILEAGFEDNTECVFVDGAEVRLEKCVMNESGTGVVVDRGRVHLIAGEIVASAGSGVHLRGDKASVTVEGTSIQNNGQYGVLSEAGTLDLQDANITDNGQGDVMDAEVARKQALGCLLQITVFQGDKQLDVVKLNDESVEMGRQRTADICLAHNTVSKRHARFLVREGRAILIDLKSTGGTFVNGQRITSATVVNHDDEIRIGPFKLMAAAG